jgi:hypothetical protein
LPEGGFDNFPLGYYNVNVSLADRNTEARRDWTVEVYPRPFYPCGLFVFGIRGMRQTRRTANALLPKGAVAFGSPGFRSVRKDIVMWETLRTLIQELPEWYLMVLIPFLLVIALYFIPRIRRDKQGKLYIHSDIYEQKKHNKKLDTMIEQIQGTEMSVLKLRILNKNNLPQDAEEAYMNYKKRGGNGYIDHFYKEYWEKRLEKQAKNNLGGEF